MSYSEKPHKDNVPGPFYVCDGCCTACDVPFDLTPEMFAYDSDNHCYVKRQPNTENELDRMIRTVLSSELECIRYRGDDKNVLRRLAESGYSHLSDEPVSGIAQLLRNYGTFDAVNVVDRFLSTQDLAKSFQDHFQAQQNEYLSYKFRSLFSDGLKTSFEYAWYKDNFHPVEISFLGLPNSQWLVITDTPFQFYDWLVAENRFCDIRWYTANQWKESKEWQGTPW